MEKDKLDVKIVSKEVAFWSDIIDKTNREIEQLNKMLKFNEAILEMAETKKSEEEEEDNLEININEINEEIEQENKKQENEQRDYIR
jgi:hypothetical protein